MSDAPASVSRGGSKSSSAAKRAATPLARRAEVALWSGLGLAALVVMIPIVVPPCRERTVLLGLVALGCLGTSSSYMVRKRKFMSRLGPLHAWLLGHMVLGGIFLLAVLVHAGGAPHGTQGWLLLLLSVAVVASGLWGNYELRATPRRFATFKSNDYMYPTAVRKRIGNLRLAIDTVIEKRKPEFGDWFRDRYGAIYRRTSSAASVTIVEPDDFPAGSNKWASQVHEQLCEIVRLRGLQVQIDAVDRRSRRWLWLHVPASVMLVVIAILHVMGWLYYG